MNILLLFIEILLMYLGIIFLYKKFKIEGLYIWSIFATLLINILVLKSVDIFQSELLLGTILNISLFLVCNIIVQNKGIEEAMKLLWIILITSLFGYIVLNMSGLIESSTYGIYTNKAYDNLLGYNMRIFAACTISLLGTLLLNINLYYTIRRLKNKIWISNMLSTIIIQFIESIIFGVFAYIITIDVRELVLLILIRYIIKVLIGVIGTIFVYKANKIKES